MAETAPLSWRLQPRFLRYVARLPDGEISLGNGAGVGPEGQFVFPAVPPGPGAAPCSFTGALVVTGHLGMIRLELGAFEFAADEEGALLTAYDGTAERRLPLVRLGPASPGQAAGRTWSTSLHPAATSLFAETYPAGLPFAPLRVGPVGGVRWAGDT